MNKIEKIESRFLNPLTDFGFHRLFGTESSKKFLISFLNEVIRDESLITDIQYLPPNQQGFTEKERKAVFDIFCTNEKGEYLIVEMQRARQKYFRDRSLFYASLPIQKQAPQGIWNFQLFVKENIFEELFQAAETNKLTKKEMKEYKKSVLEYRDVKDSIELAREEAHEKGREAEKIAIILKCFQKNMPIEDIVFLTGFSEEQIIRLISNASHRS